MPEHDSKSKTAGAGDRVLDRGRIAWKGQPGQDTHNRTHGTGQLGEGKREKTEGTGRTGQVCRDRKPTTGRPEHHSMHITVAGQLETGQPGKNSLNRTAWIRGLIG
jgi:hypothetical protein